MGYSSMKVSENREFIESDRWKCKKSPSGAHYWIVHSHKMTCKYCNYCKQIDATGSGQPEPETR